MKTHSTLVLLGALAAILTLDRPEVGAATLEAAAAAPGDRAAVRPGPLLPPPDPIRGRVRMLGARTGCTVPPFSPGGPGVPFFVADPEPRVGYPFRVQWTTKPTAPGELPSWPTMLALSFDPMTPLPLFWLGAPGCHQIVPLDVVLVPASGTILTQQGGRVFLDWTPGPGLGGTEFYGQLLVLAPGTNAASLLLSPAMQVLIGE